MQRMLISLAGVMFVSMASVQVEGARPAGSTPPQRVADMTGTTNANANMTSLMGTVAVINAKEGAPGGVQLKVGDKIYTVKPTARNKDLLLSLNNQRVVIMGTLDGKGTTITVAEIIPNPKQPPSGGEIMPSLTPQELEALMKRQADKPAPPAMTVSPRP